MDVLLPSFVRDEAAYRQALEEMAVANGLEGSTGGPTRMEVG